MSKTDIRADMQLLNACQIEKTCLLVFSSRFGLFWAKSNILACLEMVYPSILLEFYIFLACNFYMYVSGKQFKS